MMMMEDTPADGETTYLVEGDDEGALLLLQQVDGLERLRLQAVHDVHHQDGDVAQRAASVPQVTEHDTKSSLNPRPTSSLMSNSCNSVCLRVCLLQ